MAQRWRAKHITKEGFRLWIPEHLEIAQVNGNHLAADALGLVACGSIFLPFREARRWLGQGSELLEQQIRLQVDEDGVDIEASTVYHRLVLEIFLTAARFMESCERSPSPEYRAKLGQMIDFVHACTPARSPVPVVGDAAPVKEELLTPVIRANEAKATIGFQFCNLSTHDDENLR